LLSIDLIKMSNIAEQIPYVVITNNGGSESFKPRPDDLDSGIDSALGLDGAEVFRAHGLRLLSLEPTSSHNPQHGSHQVLWLDRGRYRQPKPWQNEDVQYVAENRIFWDEFERYLEVLRQERPNMWCYMSLGFFDPAQPVPEGAYPAGMQSQRRLHIHLVDPITRQSKFPRATVAPDWQLSHNLNIAGELTYQKLADDPRLAQLGSPFTYKQPFPGKVTKADFPFLYRRLHGFEDAQSALAGVVQAQSAFAEDWCQITEAFNDQKHELNGFALPLAQAACPGFSLIIPSAKDRRRGRVKEEFGAWVVPFYVSGGPQILSGVVLARDYS
jgi:hypothetical protein